MMKAIVHDRYGPPAEVLRLDDVDRPAVRADQVLVRVRAAGVNPADCFLVTGVPYLIRLGFGLRRPRQGVRGTDLAGTVVAVGRNVTRFHPGDEVLGEGRGAFAEYALAHQDKVVAKPANLTFTQAAAVTMAGLTALEALRDQARVAAGQTVLINGAAGGIGTFAVQLAKAYGAEVSGVCSTRNVELVRSIGADQVIDYTRTDFTQGSRRYDVILDNVGNHSLSQGRRLLTRGGTLIPNNGTSGGRWFGTLGRVITAKAVSPFVRQRLRPFLSVVKRDNLLALTELIAAGTVTPVVGRTYQLREAAEAIRQVETGHAQGKVVITV